MEAHTNNFVVFKFCRNIWQQHARKRKLLFYASRPLYEEKKTLANYRMPARKEPPLISTNIFSCSTMPGKNQQQVTEIPVQPGTCGGTTAPQPRHTKVAWARRATEAQTPLGTAQSRAWVQKFARSLCACSPTGQKY